MNTWTTSIELRESGVTNMYGAVPYLRKEFDLLSRDEAETILGYWMRTFGERRKASS